MKKYPLIGISIIAVVLLVFGSFNNIVGYQTVQASNQKMITSEIDQKKLLFQTIADMASNKEIQRVILGFELTSKRSFDSGMRFSIFNPPVLTKRYLNLAYHFGLILSKTISKSKIQSILKQYQVSNQQVQRDISDVIERNVILKSEVTQLSDLKCDCENSNTTGWDFPVLCTLLLPMVWLSAVLYFINHQFIIFLSIMFFIGQTLNCYWIH